MKGFEIKDFIPFRECTIDVMVTSFSLIPTNGLQVVMHEGYCRGTVKNIQMRGNMPLIRVEDWKEFNPKTRKWSALGLEIKAIDFSVSKDIADRTIFILLPSGDVKFAVLPGYDGLILDGLILLPGKTEEFHSLYREEDHS